MYAVKALVGLAQLWLATPNLADYFTETTPAVKEIGKDYSTIETSPYCDKPYIEVAGVNGGSLYTRGPDEPNNISVPYGQRLQVNCFGLKATRLIMMQDGTKLQVRQGENKIEWYMGKARPIKTEFVCIDIETNCEESFYVSVTPAMKVYADKTTKHEYINQYGNPLSVLCSGPAGTRLTMMKDGEELEIAKVYVFLNDVTIKWFEKEPDLQISQYTCTDADTGTSISVTIRVEPFFRHNMTYRLEYGKSNEIEVFCSGPRSVKLFTVEGGILHKELLTEKVTETTVKSLIVNLKTGKSTFACVDGEVPDYMSTMNITVTPRLEVASSSEIRRVEDAYYIKQDDTLEIICSGSNATQLTISKLLYSENKLKKLNYSVVNKTAIKWRINNTYMDDIIACYEEEASAVSVSIHTLPMASSFRCVSENLRYLNCSWTSSLLNSIDYTLSYMENRSSVHICTKLKSRDTEFCVWNYRKNIKVFTFLLHSCNQQMGCFNQTFHIDHVSIIKPNSPNRLTAERIRRPNAVELYWSGTNIHCASKFLTSYDGQFQYKVEYEYPGIRPVEVNSSLVSCGYMKCNIELKLPCPGQFYTFRVYQKLKETVGEEYWSPPSSVTFHSNLANGDTDVETTCNSEFSNSKEAVLYSIYKLNNEVILNMQELKRKVRSLKEKHAKIRAYLEKQRHTDKL